ncbi:cyclophilin, putative [Theileria annulata]|uniref:peptidylprolyl isomerase n=1 Tax=Theileria annulata TaxID=5874 RepID=Q4UFN3_THEAN|nr:cyclophilin, putative [Theileria annulata]CAI74083.1 cyclophilin, putative [Theileria annulata]|eukprot:XP_951815.1 cyclophilin, putative [Theileria annulata]
MKMGEKALLVIQPEYGYGKSGAGEAIPPNSVLNFEIELINFRVKPKNKWEMSIDEKLQASLDVKLDGNNKFSQGNYRGAISMYLEGLEYLSESSEWPDESMKLANTTKLQCYLNLSNCYLKVSEFRDAEKNASEALKLDNHNIKALFRRALARLNYDILDGAIEDLNSLLKLDPNNLDGQKYLKLAKQKQASYNQADKKRFGTIFSKMTLYNEKKGVRDLKSLPKVFLEISLRDKTFKMVVALFSDTVPKTAENFRKLCQPDHEFNYKNCKFHRVIRGFMVQGGDFTNGDGTGGRSIYGEKFDDENFIDKHTERGLLSMANSGPNTNGSQFFVTFGPAPHLDGKHVVFGKVVEGLEFLDELENVETGPSDRPVNDVVIVNCGSV